MAATAASLRPVAVRPSRTARASRPAPAAPSGAPRAPRRLRAVPAPEGQTAPVAAPVSLTTATVGRVMATIAAVVSVLAIVVVMQTLIAEQQLELDRTLTDVRLAQQHYDELRQTRAELRAPSHLIQQARLLGMMSGLGAKFQEVSPDAVARVMASTGNMDPLFLLPRPEPAALPTAIADTAIVATGAAP